MTKNELMEKVKLTFNLPVKRELLILHHEELQRFYVKGHLTKDSFISLNTLIVRVLQQHFTIEQIEYVYQSKFLDKYFLDLSDQMRLWLQFPEDDFFLCHGWLALLCSLRLKANYKLHFSEEINFISPCYSLQTLSYFFDFISPYLDASQNQILGGFEFSDPRKKRVIMFKDGLIHHIDCTLQNILLTR